MSITDKIYNALNETITVEGTDWRTISEYLTEKKKLKIKNWMKVRGVIQYMVSEGMIYRTDDIRNEVYCKTIQ